MTLYCGIDLHSNNSLVSIIDDDDRVHYEKRMPNELEAIVGALMTYRDELTGVVVESTYNWYWLVDGLLASGFCVHLANTIAMKQYDGLKYSDDRTDARHLAHLLRLKVLPEGHICPPEVRCVRDLLRRRLLLVRQRVTHHLSLHSLLARHTGKRLSSAAVKALTAEALDEQLTDASTRLCAHTALELMSALNEQIKRIERQVAAFCQPTRAYEVVTSVPGIGPMIGQTLLLESGSMERFASPGDYAAYARCVPSVKLGNGKKKGEGNRRNGNKYLGSTFMEAAHYAAIWEPTVKRCYQCKAARTHVLVAKKAVANKLARACYHMLKRDELFDVNKAFA